MFNVYIIIIARNKMLATRSRTIHDAVVHDHGHKTAIAPVFRIRSDTVD